MPAGIVFTQWSKNGLTHYSNKRGRGRGERTTGPSSVPNLTFIGGEMCAYSPATQNFKFCTRICPSGATSLYSFYRILSICTHLYVDFKFLIWLLSGDKQPSYRHSPTVRHFPSNFQ